MLMYALATAGNDTLLLHAVVLSCEGKGYLFLGPSETGKSTHARLWLKHIEGTELVNDDHPVVRNGVVNGSPWGGFFNYVNRLRLQHVEAYLQAHPGAPLQEAILESGFNSRQAYYAVKARLSA